jgi:hypothetical protein
MTKDEMLSVLFLDNLDDIDLGYVDNFYPVFKDEEEFNLGD